MAISELLTEEEREDLLRLAGERDGGNEGEPLPGFPQEAWTGLFADYRELVGGSTEAPDIYRWRVFLTTAGLILGHGVWVNNPHPLTPNFYSVVIGRTGSPRKTTAIKFGTDLLERIGEEVEILTGLVSSEGLYQRLSYKEGTRLLVHGDEFRALLQVARRQATSDLIPKLNSLYNCPSVDGIDRRQQPVTAISPFVGLIAGSTHGWLEDAFEKEDVSGGFLNRLLFLVGEEKRPIPFPAAPDGKRYTRFLAKLLQAIEPWEKNPGEMVWSPDAKELYEHFYLPWKARQKSLPGDLADLTSRIPEHVLKTALVYSALDGESTLTARSVAIAIAVGGHLEAVTQRLFGHVTLTRMGRIEKLIADRLKGKGGSIGLRDLRQSLRSKVETEAFNRAVQNLERAEVIKIIEEKTVAGRKRKIVILLEHEN